jgi:hypothetical protein
LCQVTFLSRFVLGKLGAFPVPHANPAWLPALPMPSLHGFLHCPCQHCVASCIAHANTAWLHALPMPTLRGFLARPLRCTNLQELEVDWQDDDHNPSSLQFEGAGRAPDEQRASMQRQLAALRSSTDFLAPTSWPACSCLTSYALQGIVHQAEDELLSAAIRTPSLASLNVRMDNASACTSLRGLSCLQRLATLALSSGDNGHPGALDDQIMASIGQLSSLQDVEIDVELFAQVGSNAGAVIPTSWSALSSLTCVFPRHGCGPDVRLAGAQLSRLVAVEDLVLEEVTVVGAMSCLAALTCLTSLVGPEEFTAPDGDAAGGDAGSSGGLAAPQQWRDGLQRLHWREYSRGSIDMLPQLTSLVYLHLEDACITPQLCRCESQGPLPERPSTTIKRSKLRWGSKDVPNATVEHWRTAHSPLRCAHLSPPLAAIHALVRAYHPRILCRSER